MLGFFTSARNGNLLSTTDSGSILREASPAAMTKQPYTLVFVSAGPLGVKRSDWQSWIMYFREAGYDCIDLNVELPKNPQKDVSNEKMLADEVTEQVRLSSLQRQPVVFLRDQGNAVVPSYLGTGGLFFGKRGPMSGLVMLHPDKTELVDGADWPSNTPVLVIPQTTSQAPEWADAMRGAKKATMMPDEWNEKEGLIKEVERWMRDAGL
ncbi:hypothetical protein MVES1_000091 [Malassezia vespertilionis]|nr:uncharacterized protein MVES1_000091 [Malassezia vespertilionis]WFD04767.1 hypothetical protein MVES1_000091 [Malassezia vespertilionis]